MRNIWAYSIIFCGHFPSGVATFTEEETENESRGRWYIRQMMGSANITGGKLFHILSGNLSHQIEHHLFPDIPARRYPQIAPEVKALCEKYGLPYNTGRLSKQIGSTWGKIFRLALPFGRRTRTAEPPRLRIVPDAKYRRGLRGGRHDASKGGIGQVRDRQGHPPGAHRVGGDARRPDRDDPDRRRARGRRTSSGTWASDAFEMRDAAGKAELRRRSR